MSKVLISFVGTGQKKKSDKRVYLPTVYRFANGEERESSFFTFSLVKHIGQVDRIILIGTIKSMWEEVYSVFAGEKADENVYLELAEHTESAQSGDELALPHIQELEQAIGTDAKVLLTKYGLDNEEIAFNNEVVFSIEEYMNNGDELYIDVTHAFRSLPLTLLNTLIYLQSVSRKQIRINTIYYGMYNQELKFAPVVELGSILKMNDWVVGAQMFRDFGNAYKIADLLEADGDKDVASRLRKFSDLLNLNHMGALMKQAQEISALKNTDFRSPMAQMLIPPIVGNFTKQFLNASKQSVFQYRLARWQFGQRRYAPAYLSLLEAIVTKVCEDSRGYSCENIDHRNLAKQNLASKSSEMRVPAVLSDVYRYIRGIRNGIAHTMANKESNKTMIDKLGKGIDLLKEVMK